MASVRCRMCLVDRQPICGYRIQNADVVGVVHFTDLVSGAGINEI